MGKYSHGIQIKESRISFSNLAVLIAGAIWLITLLGSEKLHNSQVIKDDIVYYYSYLPALFIYHDLSFDFADDLPTSLSENIWLNADSGIPKMTIGLSVMYAPFFLIAHTYSSWFDTPNGYTSPYHLMLLFAGLFYGLLGLAFLKKLLLNYFDELVVAISVLCVSLGTNLYHYAAYDGAMSHVYSFFLFAAFGCYCVAWNNNASNKNALLLGFLGGLILLVRPVNALLFMFPILINVHSIATLKSKLNWLIQNYQSVLIIAVSTFVVLIPQLLYWKYFTGNWLYYGYGSEGFYFKMPHIIDGLFSYRKGWLVYTPMMLFSLIGIYKLKKYCNKLFVFILLYIPLNIYIVFSWWCWWYGGSFGARALIESYVVLAFPLSVFIAETLNSAAKYRKIAFGSIAGLIILLNIFQSKQYDVAILHWDGMTKESYWAIFGQSERPDNYLKLISTPDYEKALLGKEESVNSH